MSSRLGHLLIRCVISASLLGIAAPASAARPELAGETALNRWGWLISGDEVSAYCCLLVGGSVTALSNRRVACTMPDGTTRDEGKDANAKYDDCLANIN